MSIPSRVEELGPRDEGLGFMGEKGLGCKS